MRKVIIIIAGVLITGCGLFGGMFYLLGMVLSGESAVDGTTIAASIMVLGGGLGGALLWQGKNALQERRSEVVRWPPAWLLLLLWLFTIGVGHLLLTYNLLPTLTFPIVHILAALFPPLIILAYAGRRLRSVPVTRREITIQLASGAFISTTLAFLAEMVIGLTIAAAAFLVAAMTPGGQALMEEIAANINNPEWLQDPATMEMILLSPPVLVTLFSLFVILAPIIEEPAKMAGVVLMSYRHPARAQFFVWGLAAGAGFALVENLFNTVVALDAWVFVVVLRLGGTMMHCLGAGINAIGWQQLLATRRPWWLLGTLAFSMVIHALWNGCVMAIAGISVFVTGQSQSMPLMVGGGVIGMLLLFLLALSVGMAFALVIVTGRLRTNAASNFGETGSEAVRPQPAA